MAVTYQTEGIKMPDIKKRETTEWIKNVAASYGKRLGEIAYIFCSDKKTKAEVIGKEEKEEQRRISSIKTEYGGISGGYHGL